MGNEFRAVVHSQMGATWMLSLEFLNNSDHIHRFAPSADTKSRAQAAIFIDYVHKFLSAAIHILIKLKSNHPYMLRLLGPQQRSLGVPRSCTFPLGRLGGGAVQSYLTPDPFHLLVFNLPALHSQETVGQPPAPAHMAQGELLDPNAQLLLSSFFKRHGPALGIAVLTR
jgi:hypothetical protein